MNDREELETVLAKYNGRRSAILCHPGINPNFLALASTMSPTHGERCLRRGQEVITSVIGSSTILNAILRLGLVPVFVDVEIPTYNANPCLVEEAVNKDTGAILLQHTLGNPVSLTYIEDKIVDGSEIWSIYDCRHAMGGIFTGTYEGLPVGSYGCLSTLKFEGKGVVLTDSTMIHSALKYERRNRGSLQVDIEQVKKNNFNVNKRRENWKFFHKAFKELEEYFILPEPHRLADPNWSGFCLTCRDINAEKLLQYLNNKDVCAHRFHVQNFKGHKIVGTTRNLDIVKKKSFWLDVSPEITAVREYMFDTIKRWIRQ